GLVEHDDPRILTERPGDLDELTLADREREEQRIGGEPVQPDALEQFAAARAKPPRGDDELGSDIAEHEILGDGEIGDDAEFLIDERDARALGLSPRPQPHLAVADPDLAGV